MRAGGTQRVHAAGFSAGEKVRAVLGATPRTVAVATADKTGSVTLGFTVPTALTGGRHQLVLTGLTSGLSAEASFRVTAAVRTSPTAPSSASTAPTASTPTSTSPSTSRGPILADTGRDGRQTRWELLLGVGLVAAGGVALLVGRRGKHVR